MGRAPEWRWADTMRAAHPPTAEEAKPTKPSHDQARGGRPAGPWGQSPHQKPPSKSILGVEPELADLLGTGVRCEDARDIVALKEAVLRADQQAGERGDLVLRQEVPLG